jgi:hypothetical protein
MSELQHHGPQRRRAASPRGRIGPDPLRELQEFRAGFFTCEEYRENLISRAWSWPLRIRRFNDGMFTFIIGGREVSSEAEKRNPTPSRTPPGSTRMVAGWKRSPVVTRRKVGAGEGKTGRQDDLDVAS